MEIINKLFGISRIKKQLIVLANDIILSFISLFLSFSLLYQKFYFPIYDYTLIILIAVFSFIPFFIPFGLYQAIFRFSGIYSLVIIFLAIFLYGLTYFLIILFANTGELIITIGILHPIIFQVMVMKLLSRFGVKRSSMIENRLIEMDLFLSIMQVFCIWVEKHLKTQKLIHEIGLKKFMRL